MNEETPNKKKSEGSVGPVIGSIIIIILVILAGFYYWNYLVEKQNDVEPNEPEQTESLEANVQVEAN